jgi:DNA-binding NarL/FixJ family response regulator
MPLPESHDTRYRVLLVDDHPVVRHGLAQYLSQKPGFHICGEAENIPQALNKVSECRPHLAIVDLSLGMDNGMRLIEDLNNRYPDIRVLVLSMHDETIYAERCLKAGAKGYVMKKEPPETVVAAANKILQGGIHVSERLGSKFLNRLFRNEDIPSSSVVDSLSNREFEVFQLLGEGLKTREIAQKLNMSVKTVETHYGHMKRKLGLKEHREIFKTAVQWRINEGNK